MTKPFNISILKQSIELMMETYPELRTDEDLRLDMLEGSTNLLETIEKSLETLQETQALSDALHQQIQALRTRKDRFDNRINFYRELIKKLMEIGDLNKLQLPAATLSLTSKPVSVVIFDETQIPDDFMRIKKEPNKTKIKSELEAGKPVTGAALSNGGKTLTVRG